MALTSARLVLVPLLLLCVSPSPSQSVIPNPFWAAVVLVSLVGLTNGYLGTVAMVRGPKLVNGKHQELAGQLANRIYKYINTQETSQLSNNYKIILDGYFFFRDNDGVFPVRGSYDWCHLCPSLDPLDSPQFLYSLLKFYRRVFMPDKKQRKFAFEQMRIKKYIIHVYL